MRMIVGVWVLVGETKGEGVVGSCTGVWGSWGIAGVAGVVVGVPEKRKEKIKIQCGNQNLSFHVFI